MDLNELFAKLLNKADKLQTGGGGKKYSTDFIYFYKSEQPDVKYSIKKLYDEIKKNENKYYDSYIKQIDKLIVRLN